MIKNAEKNASAGESTTGSQEPKGSVIKVKKARPYKISPNSLPEVNEPSVYTGMVQLASTQAYQPAFVAMNWLGMAPAVANGLLSDFDLIKLGATGITKENLNSLAAHIGISRKSMAEDILDVSVKTLERKDANTKLDKKTSSHAVEIAKLVQHAFEVFQDEEKVKLWLNRENKALNNLKPVQLFDTLTGLNMVNDILGRIEEGVYS